MTPEDSRAAARSAAMMSISAALLCLAVLAPFLVGVLAGAISDDLGFRTRDIGAIVTAYFTSAAIVGPLGGRTADAVGWKMASAAGLSFSAAALAGIGFYSPALLPVVGWMIIGGIGLGITGPASNLAIASEVTDRLRGRAFGIKQSAPPLALGLAGAALPTIALAMGWRAPFRIGALAAICAVALLLLSHRGAYPRTSIVQPAPSTSSLRALASGSLLWISLAVFFGTMAAGALTAFATTALTDAGVATESAGIVVAAGSCLAIVVRIGGGWATDVTGSDGIRPAALLLGAGTIGYLMLSAGSTPLAITGILLAFGGGWGWIALLLNGVVTTYFHAPGSATGVVQIGGSGGTALGPIIFGLSYESIGSQAAWVAPAVWAGLASLLIGIVAAKSSSNAADLRQQEAS